MTEEHIKEMLNDIINNGAEYEFRWLRTDGWSDWKPYRLGEEILYNDSRYEYRKVENWSVIEWNDTHTLEVRTLRNAENTIGAFIQITFKTKEECEKWIEEHTQKTWLDETFPLGLIVGDLHMEGEKERLGATKVCKKILDEVNKNVVFKDFENYEHGKALCITLDKLEKIIKDLGVNV